MSHQHVSPQRSRATRALLGLLVAALGVTMIPGVADAAKGKGKKKGQNVTVMTRNVYLGADLGPGLAATNLDELADGAGEVVNQVDRTNFPLRAKALAARDQEAPARPRGPAGGRALAHRAATRSTYSRPRQPRSSTTSWSCCWRRSTTRSARRGARRRAASRKKGGEVPALQGGRRQRGVRLRDSGQRPRGPKWGPRGRGSEWPSDHARRDPRQAESRRQDPQAQPGHVPDAAAGQRVAASRSTSHAAGRPWRPRFAEAAGSSS